jgi:signal transduction histidine kinase
MNVTKHAGAHHVVLDVRREDGTVRLEVGDDGRGFDPDDPTPGFGLVGMRERVALAGGSLTVTPGEGGGTRVVATIPLPAA